MLNRSASLAMSTSVLKALPGKLDIKRHSPSILYFHCTVIFVRSALQFMTLNRRLNIGIAHVFSCIDIRRVPRKLFEHEAVRPSVQTSSEGPGKC